MAENAPLWPMMDGTYLEVKGCLGAALVGLVGGDMDFKDSYQLDHCLFKLRNGWETSYGGIEIIPSR